MRRPSRQGLSHYCLCVSHRAVVALPDSDPRHFALGYPARLSLPENILSFCLLLGFAFIIESTYGQDTDAGLHDYFHQIRRGINPTFSFGLLDASKPDAQLTSILPFLSDSNRTVRAKACELVFNITVRAPDSIPQHGVNALLKVCLDSDSETTGIALGLLTKFTRDNFTEYARNLVRDLIDSKPAFAIELTKLAGFLELSDLAVKVRSYTLPEHRPALRWAALIALARMGDDQAITEVMSRVKRLPVSDQLIYDILPDLVFTRQRMALNYLVELLNDPVPNCQSADIERPISIPCGYRIMELLAPVIHDYPLKVRNDGDLDTDDYPSALMEARRWFAVHKEYRIMTKRY